jgi:hypothetical protein
MAGPEMTTDKNEGLTEHQKYLKRLGVYRQGEHGIHPAWLPEEAPDRIPIWVAIFPIALFGAVYYFFSLIAG